MAKNACASGDDFIHGLDAQPEVIIDNHYGVAGGDAMPVTGFGGKRDSPR